VRKPSNPSDRIRGTLPRVTFGIIVLNGHPFTAYNLRSLYPLAHQIIVVEGAAPAATAIAGPDGHSVDGTLDVVRRFMEQEDPERKVLLVTAEDDGHPNGFWPGEKHEQSQAYARRATGDYLWQIDIDEFYRPDDARRFLEHLAGHPEVTQASFRQITFWGGLDYACDSWYLRRGASACRRVFRWGPGYRYVTHRPPTIHDGHGRDMGAVQALTAGETDRLGIRMFHYSLLFPHQVREKCAYYGKAEWNPHASGYEAWARDVYLRLQNPYRAHNVFQLPGWIERFRGEHPPEVERLMSDIRSGKIDVELRRTDDIEKLLASPGYAAGRMVLKVVDPVHRRVAPLLAAVRRRLVRALDGCLPRRQSGPDTRGTRQ